MLPENHKAGNTTLAVHGLQPEDTNLFGTLLYLHGCSKKSRDGVQMSMKQRNPC